MKQSSNAGFRLLNLLQTPANFNKTFQSVAKTSELVPPTSNQIQRWGKLIWSYREARPQYWKKPIDLINFLRTMVLL